MRAEQLKRCAVTFVATASLLTATVAFAGPGPGRVGPGPGRGGPDPGFGRSGPGPGNCGPGPVVRRHHDTAFVVGAGLLGAGLLASVAYDMGRPSSTVVYSSGPVVYSSGPVVYATTAPIFAEAAFPPNDVVAQPAPVVVAQPFPAGYYVNQTRTVWVDGGWLDEVTPSGGRIRIWQAGHYETRTVPVWVSSTTIVP